MSKLISLPKGHYLGTVTDICDAGGIIAGSTTYKKEILSSQQHYHENAHISFVLQGGSVEKRTGKEIERLPGNIEFYHAGEKHQTIQKVFPSKHINLEIDTDFLKKNEITEATIYTVIKQNPDGKFLLLKIYRELLVNDDSSAASINMLFLDLISKFENRSYKILPLWVEIVREFLNENWDEKITLNDLSTAANVHPITISKYFKKYFSCTFGEYIRKLKIEKSLSLLKTKSSSLTAAAYTCNFADQSHFTRTFKELTGFLPKQYYKL
jgi:AraC-type DNA-binding domain-containing proteins